MLPLILLVASALEVTAPDEFQLPFKAETRREAEAWQQAIRERLLDIVEAQCPKKETPLETKAGEYKQEDGYRQADLRLTGNDGKSIEATLTVPEGEGPWPAVLCLHGHGGSREAVHDGSSNYGGFGAEYAKRGFVTLAPTLWHCEYAANQLWNLMRLIDVLTQLDFVDARRIGCAGLSMGGEWTMWLAACDTRVRAAVVSGWMCTTEGVLRVPNCECWMAPGLLELCDVCEVHILIAPRPLLFESAIEDGCFPIDATRAGYEKVKRGYAVFGSQENVRQHTFPGGHAWNGGQAYEFMGNALR
jgi:dienelactone hydrolase